MKTYTQHFATPEDFVDNTCEKVDNLLRLVGKYC